MNLANLSNNHISNLMVQLFNTKMIKHLILLKGDKITFFMKYGILC
jgi:hypothetical protein